MKLCYLILSSAVLLGACSTKSGDLSSVTIHQRRAEVLDLLKDHAKVIDSTSEAAKMGSTAHQRVIVAPVNLEGVDGIAMFEFSNDSLWTYEWIAGDLVPIFEGGGPATPVRDHLKALSNPNVGELHAQLKQRLTERHGQGKPTGGEGDTAKFQITTWELPRNHSIQMNSDFERKVVEVRLRY